MKNQLPEQHSSSSNSRGCLTLDPKQICSQLPPLLEQRSSLLNKVPSSRPSRKINTSEPKLKRAQQQNHPSLLIHYASPSEESVDKLIKMLLEKGRKIPEFLITNGLNDEAFLEPHFRCSPTVRAQLKTALQKLLSKGQVGADLKGVNKPILERIQAGIKESLESQRELYMIKTQFQKQSQNISKNLSEYRAKVKRTLGELDIVINIR